ncbi:MAG: hypothetical protein ACI9W6_002582, partial [Motiliproteus sp.]
SDKAGRDIGTVHLLKRSDNLSCPHAFGKAGVCLWHAKNSSLPEYAESPALEVRGWIAWWRSLADPGLSGSLSC